MKKITAALTVAAMALVVPVAGAHNKPPTTPTGKQEHGPAAHKPAKKHEHPSGSHKCKPHAVAYRVGGTLVSGALTRNADDGTYSGTLVVHVTSSNHQARADRGTDKSYTLDHARVNLHGQDPAALKPGSRVHLKGTATKLSKKCDATGFTSTLKIKRATIKPPKTAAPKTETEAPKTETKTS